MSQGEDILVQERDNTIHTETYIINLSDECRGVVKKVLSTPVS